LRRCVEDSLALFAGRAQAKGLQMQCTIAAGAPSRVAGDATRLRQILVNLLDNAIKFSEQGEVALSQNSEHLLLPVTLGFVFRPALAYRVRAR